MSEASVQRPIAKSVRFGVLGWIVGAFFLAAVILAAAPAFRAGPATWAGLLLLGGLASLAFIALIGWRGAAAVRTDVPDFETLARVLGEPAAIVAADGAIEGANGAWRETFGEHRRLQKSDLDDAYGLMRAAKREGRASKRTSIGGVERTLETVALAEETYLLRLVPLEPAAPVGPEARSLLAPGQAQGLGAFAAASPFGAALIEGTAPFDGPILEVNEAWAAVAGAALEPGATLGSLIAPQSRLDTEHSLASGGAGPFEVTPTARPESFAHLYLLRSEGRSVAYLVDVTEHKQMQTQLAQSNKMQAIGQLAGGVAHDFNNLLSGINLRLDELLQRHLLGDPSYQVLSEIRRITTGAANLVRELLTFSRQATIQREKLDLGEVISNFEVLLRRLIPANVSLATDYGRNLPLVRADKAQLETAVMNLVVNARDAVKMNGGATIRLRVARLTNAEALAQGYGGGPAAELALIEVADDGPGIAPETVGKIFEPFFTTKPQGEGTGLGLATVYGIVKQSDGWISVDSKPGEGAAFRIFLPVYEPPVLVEPPAPAAPRGRPAARDLSGVGRILFVEDEDDVRGIAAKLLRARGYEVLEAADGEEALILAEANAGQIDLMISDVIMPGMNGPALLKKARGYLGEAPVMFISGYAEAEFSDLLEGEPGVSFLAKPIDIKTLAERVKQELQAA